MGEIKIKSGNLFDGELEQGSLGTSAGQEYPTTTRVRIKKPGIDLQPGTYTIDCVGTTGGVVVYVYNKDSSWDKEQSNKNWRSLPSTFSLSSERLVRFVFRKTGDSDILPSEVTDIQLLEGTYTSETIPEYQPYFLNRPAHQFTNGQFVDIPTHHFINGRWQGELTSQSPLKFWADGEMLDWRVEGRTSGNLVESVTVSSDQTLYGIPLFLEAELKPDTLYTFAFQLTEGYFVYWNEYLFTNETPLVTGAGDTVLVVTKRTRSDISKDQANQYRSSKGWVIHKNMKTESFPASYTNVQLLEGTYTADTLPPYEPYGGVGDWDEDASKYKIPVVVESGTAESETKQAYISANGQYGTTSYTWYSVIFPCKANTKYRVQLSIDGFDLMRLGRFPQVPTAGSVASQLVAYTDPDFHNGEIITTGAGYIVAFGYRGSEGYTLQQYLNALSITEVDAEIDLYIGDSQLQLDEYTSYKDQKIYKYVNGVLTPTDPPVPIPALPIIQGENTLTVDTAVKPKSVFVKFEG